ncbi:MAG: hypothetical protein ACE5FV_09430 [Woeseia sp.]
MSVRSIAFLGLLSACSALPGGPGTDDIGFGAVVEAARLQNHTIREASGLARSNRHSEILWTMNDEGPPVLYAIGTDGSDHGSVYLRTARNIDWEDLAAFELDGKSYLLVADVGDNESRRAHGVIYVVEEPTLSRGQHLEADIAWRIRFSYPDGPLDCEAVAVDPSNARILLLAKRRIPATLYELPLRPDRDRIIRARRIGDLDTLPQPTEHDIARALPDNDWHWQPTAMDLSADGRTAAVLTYRRVYVYPRRAGEGWARTFARQPEYLDLAGRREAEAVTLSRDGKAIFVTLEGALAPILRFDRQ